MIESIFLQELILIRQANQKSAMFVTIGIFLNKEFKFQPNVCNGYHDLVMMPINLSNTLLFETVKVLIIAAL